MRRELAWVGLVLALAAGWALRPRPPQHVSAFGVSTRMSEAEVRARLGAPDERKLVLRDGEWSYRLLGLEMDFQFQGARRLGVSDLYATEIQLDNGFVLSGGRPVAEIRRVFGSPNLDTMNLLRFQVGEDILEVHLDRVQQTVKAYHILWRARPPAQP